MAHQQTAALFKDEMAWYAKDERREILREFIEVLEHAGTDTAIYRRV